MRIRLPPTVRRILDPITSRIPVPILQGINRGRFWSLASSGGGYASGVRGADQMRVLYAMLRAGDVVWDIGAHHGYVSLAAARVIGANGKVHAFEPSSDNAAYLRRHLMWNKEIRVTSHQLAIGAHNGTASFGGGSTSKMHALGTGDEQVEVRRADTLVSEGKMSPPDVFKIDVEGGEADALEGLLPVLPDTVRGTIAVHSRAIAERLLERLSRTDCTVLQSVAFRQSYTGTGWRGDPDLYLIGPAGDPQQTLQRSLSALGVRTV